MSQDLLCPMTGGDLEVVAVLHREQLRHGLFPRLGARFLRGYHHSFVDSPHAVALVSPEGDAPAGFLVGTLDHEAHHRWVIRKHGLRLAALGVLGLLARPRVLWWFLRTRFPRYTRALWRALAPGTRPPGAAGGSGGEPIGVLMHVAVDPTARGRGRGRRLVGAYVAAAREAGCDDIRLVTRAHDGAEGFYRRLGWHRAGRRGSGEAAVLEYRYPVEESPPQ